MSHRDNTRRLQLVTPDTDFPLSLDEVREHCGVAAGDDDSRLNSYLAAATKWAENAVRGGIATRTQTWELLMYDFPGGSGSQSRITIPKPPLQSVTSISYLDSDSETQTLTENTDYLVSADYQRAGWIEPMPDTYWPTVKDQRADGVTIRFIAGHTTRELVPENIKHAMLMTIAHWNENRETVIVGTNATEVPQAATMLITQSEYGTYA